MTIFLPPLMKNAKTFYCAPATQVLTLTCATMLDLGSISQLGQPAPARKTEPAGEFNFM